MQVFRRVPRGSQRVIPATATQSQSWLSAQDMDLLAKQLDKMRKPVKNAFTAGSATNRFILSVPPEQMQERLFQVMSVYNLVHALILSGLIGVALTPLDPDNFGEGKASFVHAFNIVVSLVLVCSGSCVCTSTWALANVASLTQETAFRFVLHSDAWWIQEALSAFEMMLLVAASVLAVWIRNSTLVSAIISGMAFVVAQLVMGVHHKWMLQADPHVGWSYAMGMNSDKRPERRDAERLGGMLAREVEVRLSSTEVGAALLPKKGDSTASGIDASDADALASLVEQAQTLANGHPRNGGEESRSRSDQIALELASAGLQVRLLRAAAAEGVDVYTVLRDVIGLTTGERLSIAMAVRRLVAT